jgi:4,5-DOPA dioxygenase extradiol
MYALEANRYTAAWADLGKKLTRPEAILVISAHWLTRGVWATAMQRPQTIHDFGGFPETLFSLQYPAPGSPHLAQRIKTLLAPMTAVVLEENEWGIDHGAWSVLRYLYPDADVPVVQMSLNGSLDAQGHYDLARQLAPLRTENILILASGNVVHNLRTIHWQEDAEPYAWAREFNNFFVSEMCANHHETLIDWEKYGEAAHMSIPTAEHYWPALSTRALQEEDEYAKVYTDGIEMSSISMLGFSIQ